MGKPFDRLNIYWQNWGSRLNEITAKRGCKLAYPVLTTDSCNEYCEDGICVGLTHPICLYGAPMKASSKAGSGSSKRLAIFIDGEMYIPGMGEASLLHGSCNISFFRIKKPGATNAFEAELVDTAHFDMEKDPPSAFHPVLHVQRGLAKNLERCRDAVSKVDPRLVGDKIHLEVGNYGEIAANPYLRIPTPQMDIFALSTIIAADYFCSGGDIAKEPAVLKRFQGLLKLLTADDNVIRAGRTAARLHERIKGSRHTSVAHWFAEFL